eukprot:scaffold80971_cov51-Phaeocystis_antarctica.AAC.3
MGTTTRDYQYTYGPAACAPSGPPRPLWGAACGGSQRHGGGGWRGGGRRVEGGGRSAEGGVRRAKTTRWYVALTRGTGSLGRRLGVRAMRRRAAEYVMRPRALASLSSRSMRETRHQACA